MSDTLPRLNLDDARAVRASCDGAPHASGAACQRERAALIEEVAQLRAALERLGSAEAFTRAGIIGGHWVGKELQARVAYARAALGVNNT